LRGWLDKYDGPILPPNAANDISKIRKQFGIGKDFMRHTFITMHLFVSGSYAATSRQAGNSEGIIKDHYEGLATREESVRFWTIAPTA
jgi:hypothetical protein